MLSRDDISLGRLEDLGVPLRGDAKSCPWEDVDGEVHLVAADEPAAIGKQEDEHRRMVGGGGRGDEFQWILECDFGEGGEGGRLEVNNEVTLAWGGEGLGEGGGHIDAFG